MKKCNKVILPISIISFSFALISLNHALATYLNSSNASDLAIGISGVMTKLGDADYYLFWNDDDPVALTYDNDIYSYTQNVLTTGDYSYKITDAYSKTIYQSNSFNLGLTGDFSLSFDSTSKESSLTYSFSIEDDGQAFGEGMYCYPTTSELTASNCWIVGSFSNWSLGSSSRVQMYVNGDNTSDKGIAKHVYFKEGDSFKFVSGSGWYGSQHLYAATGFSEFSSCFSCNSSSDDNITVKATGYYDFALNSSNEMYVSKSVDSDYTQGTINDTVTTFTLDATKYASNNMYLSFYGSNTNALIEAATILNLFFSKTNVTCVLSKNIYLKPSNWNSANAWFVTQVSNSDKSKTENIKMEEWSDNSYFVANISTIYSTANFYRMDPSDTSLDPNKCWNKVVSLSDNNSIDVKNYSCFEITVPSDSTWAENDSAISSIPTGAPLYTLTH